MANLKVEPVESDSLRTFTKIRVSVKNNTDVCVRAFICDALSVQSVVLEPRLMINNIWVTKGWNVMSSFNLSTLTVLHTDAIDILAPVTLVIEP